jgi:hypothetical protein
VNYSGSCGNPFHGDLTHLRYQVQRQTHAAIFLKRRRLGERGGRYGEEMCSIRAYFIGLVEGRVADPGPDPEKIRIGWVAGS